MDFLLTGIGYTDVAHTAARLAMGTFFAISGFHKLFYAQRHNSIVETFKVDHVPFIGFNQWFVPCVEFFGGLGLIVGLLTPLAAAGVFAVCLVATLVDGLKRIAAYDPIDRADWIDDVLYLPEVIYLVVLGFFITAGAGPWSMDALLLPWWQS